MATFKCATMFEKNILLTSEVPGLQPQCHSRNRSLMPVRRDGERAKKNTQQNKNIRRNHFSSTEQR